MSNVRSSSKRQTAEQSASASTRTAATLPWWAWPLGIVVALLACLEVYGPALHGQFVFDDQYLPFYNPAYQAAPFSAWIGVRPVLMFSYWLNYQNSGLDPQPYHMVSLLLHTANAALIWIVLRRLLLAAGEIGFLRELLSALGAALFLLHPVNSESVAYVASRSETLSVFLFLAAYAVFLCRPAPVISWGRTVAVLLLYGLAVTTKEHAVVLPGLLLLTDYFITTPFRFDGIRGNVRLYGPIAAIALAGLAFVWKVLSAADSAGFQVKKFTWYEYLFTQFHVIWTYLRLYVLPVGLHGDWSYPVSRTLLNPFTILAFAGLLGVSWLAWTNRRQYPLTTLGWFGFLLLLAPTSSVIPIHDVIAERRLYLPFFCLVLITVDVLRRWRVNPALLATAGLIVLTAAGYATSVRSTVWSNNVAFWTDVVEKSPDNARAWFNLAYGQWAAGNCADSLRSYERTAKLEKPDSRVLTDWALALDCSNKADEAVAKLREAHQLTPTAHILSQIGMVYAKRNRMDEALSALNEAKKLDPTFDMTYVYEGNIAAIRGDLDTASRLYRHALALNPRNESAAEQLGNVERRMATQQRNPTTDAR